MHQSVCLQSVGTVKGISMASWLSQCCLTFLLSRLYRNMDRLLAIAIDPSYISKSGKKIPHVGSFVYGYVSSMKHGLKIMGLAIVSSFRNTASLYYMYVGSCSNRHGRSKTLDGKINYKKLDLTCIAKMHIEELKDSLYTIIAYSKTLKQKLRFVIWVMLMRTTSFFSTKTSISGQEVLCTYRSRF